MRLYERARYSLDLRLPIYSPSWQPSLLKLQKLSSFSQLSSRTRNLRELISAEDAPPRPKSTEPITSGTSVRQVLMPPARQDTIPHSRSLDESLGKGKARVPEVEPISADTSSPTARSPTRSLSPPSGIARSPTSATFYHPTAKKPQLAPSALTQSERIVPIKLSKPPPRTAQAVMKPFAKIDQNRSTPLR